MDTSLAIIVIAIILILLYVRAKTEKEILETKPNVPVENDTLVLIHGDYESIKKVLATFCKLHNEKSVEIHLRLVEYAHAKSFILFPYDIAFDKLCLLHNYLNYPSNVSNTLDVTSWTSTKIKMDWVHEKMLSKNIQLYISETETGYDNVYAITENNVCFKIDFAEGVSEIENLEKRYTASVISADIIRGMPYEDIQ
jgi:hypothetical protein